MTRVLEAKAEERQARLDAKLVKVVEFDLVDSVAYAGGILTGFSVRFDGDSVLVTLRAQLPAGNQVAFVAAESLSAALRKCAYTARRDNLVWKPSKF